MNLWKARLRHYDSSLRRRFSKVLKLRSTRENNYTFECKDLDTKESKVLQCQMLGLLEAANRAFQEMKNAKDVLFLDCGNQINKKERREAN